MIQYIREFGQRKIAILLLMILLSELIVPSVALALTSGPTTPETTSFEPVDTTDMVNLQTGDLTYNIPLLEVPGPEGGYPLSLSYHAGILPGEDASWVGLGWTLNPGALNRSVNGYPDDWNNQQQTVRDYWVGGTQTSYNVGISVGLAGSASVGLGLEFSNDTYRGFGVGGNVRGSVGIYDVASVSVNIGISGYGDVYGGIGVGVVSGRGGGNIGLSIGLEFSGEGVNAGVSGGVGYGLRSGSRSNMSLVGSSIGTGGTKPSLSIGGLSSIISNQNAGKISTDRSGFGLEVPVWYGVNINLGYNKTRYWSDESASTHVHGSLHPSRITADINQHAYDTYSLLDNYGEKSFLDEPDARFTSGGSFLDIDQYSVNAQGLAGNIKPYFFQGSVFSQRASKAYNLKGVSYPENNEVVNHKPYFRFVHDFSNSYIQSYPNNGFDTNPMYGNGSSYGYAGGNKLAGSKSIETYTLDQVPVKPRNSKGYSTTWVKDLVIDGKTISSGRSELIGGFSITNESGVTYHFSLPAYSYREEIYQEIVDAKSKGLSYNRQTKAEPYAYTWHLTAITGSDYVDRNNNKVVDDEDWGYWVSFEYGKSSSGYIWRNPDTGFHRDEDGDFQGMSLGTKEVYYLNAIRTRSHIAVFEKDFRLDGKGGASVNYVRTLGSGSSSGKFDHTSVHSMRLDRIFLFNAADSLLVNPSLADRNAYRGNSSLCANCELPVHLVDRFDIEKSGRNQIEDRALMILEFDYNYSLALGTPNSFDINNPDNKLGKLTLKGYRVRGKGGVNILPSTTFDYDLPSNDASLVDIHFTSTSTFKAAKGKFNAGDMLEDKDGNYLGIVTNNGTFPLVNEPLEYIYTFRRVPHVNPDIGFNSKVRITKNPPYSGLHKDDWGYYKSDYQLESNEDHNFSVHSTELSGKSVDAWSLRRISSPLGSKINIGYESDDYSEAVFMDNISPRIEGLTRINEYQIKFKLKSPVPNIHQFLKVGDNCKGLLTAECVYHYPNTNDWPFNNSRDRNHKIVFNSNLTVTSVVGDEVFAVSDTPLRAELLNDRSSPKQETLNLLSGNLQMSSLGITRNGGGVRVKSLSVEDYKGDVVKTDYGYNQIEYPNVSSGVTSYLPSILPKFEADILVRDEEDFYHLGKVKEYKRLLYRDYEETYILAREIPPPSVMYKNVSVSQTIYNKFDGLSEYLEKKVYEFETIRKNMAGRLILSHQDLGDVKRNQVIKKFLSAVGNVRSVKIFNKNNVLIKEVINKYLHDEFVHENLLNFMVKYQAKLAQYNNQGLFMERVMEIKRMSFTGSPSNTVVMHRIYSGKEEFPCIQTHAIEIDYISGTKVSSHNMAFDFYSGSLTEQLTEDGYGNRFLTVTTPAYRKYEEMGVNNRAFRKNMLSQVAETVVYKVDENNEKLGVVSANVQTWSNTRPVLTPNGERVLQYGQENHGNVWRMATTYQWNPTQINSGGLVSMSDFIDMNFESPSTTSQWQYTGEISLYNVYSKALEVRDVNYHYSSSRLGYKNSKIVVSGGPAKYTELAFSSAEDETIQGVNTSDVLKGEGNVSGTNAHTGDNSLLLAGGKQGFVYTAQINSITAGRSYAASVWVKTIEGSNTKLYYQINGLNKGNSVSSTQSTKRAGDWTLLTLQIKGSDLLAGTSLKVFVKNDHASLLSYVDDFRFQPMDVSSLAYVYDGFSGELTYVLDNNNMFVQYKYDGIGRLIGTYKEKMDNTVGKVKLTETQYNYGKKIEDIFNQPSFEVYARLELSNYYSEGAASYYQAGSYVEYADIWAKFYWDINCTQPAILPLPLVFNFVENHTWYDDYGSGSGMVVNNKTVDQGTNGVLIGARVVIQDDYSYWDDQVNRNIVEGRTTQYHMIDHHSQNRGSYIPMVTKF